MDRLIFTSTRRGRNDLKELLQGIFAAELLSPSRELWLVSPWISNITVIDDSSGRFRRLNSTGRGSLFLVDVLARLGAEGSLIHVVTRPEVSAAFLTALRGARASREGLDGSTLRVIERETLHAKGLAGDRYCLWGSMNLTWSGTSRWDELVEFTDGDKAERIRRDFRNEYLTDAS